MVRFLIDASLPRPTAELIRSFGHDATDVRDITLGTAPDDVIAEHARRGGFTIITRDQDFGDVRRYPPATHAGIVVIRPPDRAGRAMVLDMIRRLLNEHKIIDNLPGHLVTVEPTRVRVRPG